MPLFFFCKTRIPQCYIRNSGHYGLAVEGINKQGVGLELLYQREQTHAPVYDKNQPSNLLTSKDNVSISYFMANGICYIRSSQKLNPFLGIGIGIGLLSTDAATISGSQAYSNSQTKFSWDAKLGAKYKLSSKFSVKLQAQMFAIANVNGQGIYIAETSRAWAYQFGFTGGVCYRLYKAKPAL